MTGRLYTPNIRRTRNNAQTQLVNSVKQVVDKDILSSFRQSYRSLFESISVFLTHNNETISFHDTISERLKLFDETFKEFSAVLGKVNPRKLFSAQTSVPTPTRTLVNDALPFFRAWLSLTEIFDEVNMGGCASISDQVEQHFSVIGNIINNCMVYAEDSPVRCQVMKKGKMLNSQMERIKADVLKILYKNDHNINDDHGVSSTTTELRNFSRSINSTFRNEFSFLKVNVNELESMRNTAFNLCSNIIYGIKATKMFDSDIEKVQKNISDFQSVLEALAMKYNLSIFINSSGKTTTEFNTDDIKSIDEMLQKTIKYIQDGGLDPLFLIKVLDIIKNKVTFLQNEVQLLNDLNPSDLAQKLKASEEKIKIYEIERRSYIDSNITAKTPDYKQCLYDTINSLRARVDPLANEKLKVKSEDDIIPTFKALMDLALESPIRDQHTKENQYLYTLLKVDTDDDVFSMVSKLLKCYDDHVATFESLKPINDKLGLEDNYETIEDNCSAILTEVSKLVQNANLDTLNNFMSDISKIFKINSAQSPTKILIQVSEINRKNESIIQNYEIGLREIESRLIEVMKVSKSQKPPLPAILDLVDNLGNSKNNFSSGYSNLAGLYTKLQVLVGVIQPIALNAGSEYFDQINPLVERLDSLISENIRVIRHHKKDLKESVAYFLALEKKLSSILQVPSEFESANEDEIHISRVAAYVCKLADKISGDFIDSREIRDVFNKQGEPKVILNEISKQVQSIESSLVPTTDFIKYIDKTLEDIASANNIMVFTNVTNLSHNMHKILNEVAASSINSTMFMLMSRMATLTSALVSYIPQN